MTIFKKKKGIKIYGLISSIVLLISFILVLIPLLWDIKLILRDLASVIMVSIILIVPLVKAVLYFFNFEKARNILTLFILPAELFLFIVAFGNSYGKDILALFGVLINVLVDLFLLLLLLLKFIYKSIYSEQDNKPIVSKLMLIILLLLSISPLGYSIYLYDLSIFASFIGMIALVIFLVFPLLKVLFILIDKKLLTILLCILLVPLEVILFLIMVYYWIDMNITELDFFLLLISLCFNILVSLSIPLSKIIKHIFKRTENEIKKGESQIRNRKKEFKKFYINLKKYSLHMTVIIVSLILGLLFLNQKYEINNKLMKNIFYRDIWGNVYYKNYDHRYIKLKDLTVNSFRCVGISYCMDNQHVYYVHRDYLWYLKDGGFRVDIVRSANVDTFREIKKDYGEDKYSKYYKTQIIHYK
ncbi:hypothetical protein GF362_01145 [Candidatus Dojkabacteria bacterium]|nr:hypothetical protein [Candidatus Dojkabacteria bacterium]